MLNVMLVDDEPFILQGLEVLINWEEAGFRIVKLAENGQEAIDFLKENQVDLILADIKMPVTDGIQLLETIRRENLSDALYIILSGYNDFNYAQRAIRSGCMDYILKPVQKENLLSALQKVRELRERSVCEEIWKKQMQKIQIERAVVSVLQGNAVPAEIREIEKNLQIRGSLRYVHIGMDIVRMEEELSDDELTGKRRQMYESVRRFLGKDIDHCFFDMIGYEREYEIAFLYDQGYEQEDDRQSEKTEMDFFHTLHRYVQNDMEMPVYLLAGKKVKNVCQLGHSYAAACMLRSFIGFREKKSVYFYEQEIQTERNTVILCKKSLDQLIVAIQNNNRTEMNRQLDQFYNELEQTGMDGNVVNMNINYLLFQLIHLAVDQDEQVNQEEIMQRISENVFESQTVRGSRAHMRRFVLEYAEYLNQLRKDVSSGILKMIEQEIRENYAENLTLKELGQKYYINSSYLGQIFRKKYGQSFHDYLSLYRISKAEQLLLHTEKKVSVIAEEVGYHNLDYFINRFIAVKGVTPARFRRLSQ